MPVLVANIGSELAVAATLSFLADLKSSGALTYLSPLLAADRFKGEFELEAFTGELNFEGDETFAFVP